MSFGLDAGISRNTNCTAQVAKQLSEVGTVEDMTTHGAEQSVVEEVYSDSFTNEAVNGQTGTAVIPDHNYIEVNVDYARETKTTLTAGAAPTTTTTTTTL